MPRPYGGHYLDEEQKKLVEDNMYFLWFYFKKEVQPRYKRLGEETIDELLAALCWGICLAAETFDPKKGKFTTHCGWHFRSAITEYFRLNEHFFSRHQLTPFIMDDNISDDEGRCDHQEYFVPKRGGIVEKYDADEIEKKRCTVKWSDLSRIFDKIDLTVDEEQIIHYVYCEKYSLVETAGIMGYSSERVRQIKEEAIGKAKAYVKENHLEYEDFAKDR